MILLGKLDYTQYFENPESMEKFEIALKGRCKTNYFLTEPEIFSKRIRNLEQEIEEYKLKHNIEWPPKEFVERDQVDGFEWYNRVFKGKNDSAVEKASKDM
jgi:hypothetical protein